MSEPIELKDIKKGQLFAESEYGQVVVCRAIEDAHEVSEEGRCGWQCRGRVIDGHAGFADEDGIVMFFEAHDAGAYGPNLEAVPEDDVITTSPKPLPDEPRAVAAGGQGEWISVEDRLPEDHGSYLTSTRSGAVTIKQWNNLPDIRKWGNYGTDMEYWTAAITHWMPLPQPPEEA